MRYEKLFELAKPHLEKNYFGVAHTKRVFDVARQYFNIPDKIKEKVYALIILHDIGGSSLKEQYEKGPEIADRLMREVGYKSQTIEDVCAMIGKHHERIENPSEAFKILYDADHLAMFSKEEFLHYNSRPNFDWEMIINDFYDENSKNLAKKLLKERRDENG